VTQDGKVEPDVLADDDPAPERLEERLDQVREARGPGDVRVGNTVDAGGLGGDCDPRIDVRVDSWLAADSRSVHRHRTDLDHAVARDVEPRGLEIERDRRQRRERGVARKPVRVGEGGPLHPGSACLRRGRLHTHPMIRKPILIAHEARVGGREAVC